MAGRGLLAGIAALAALVVGASVALAGDLFLMQVAKHKAGPYGAEAHLNVPPDKTRRAYFRISNNTLDPVESTFTQNVFSGSPKIKLRWYRGQIDITKDVKGEGYVSNIPENSTLIVTLRASATGNGKTCLEGVADAGAAHQSAPVSINNFCTTR